MRKLFLWIGTLAFLLLLLLVSVPARAQPAEDTTATAGSSERIDLLESYRRGVRVKRLENGLVLITKENHAAPVASVYAMVRAGALWEQEYLGAGISHLTEHLVSGGSTAGRSEEQIQETLSEIGAMTNAFTSKDRTAYFIDTVPDHVGTAITLLADNLQNAAIKQEEFDREFGVVQREILNGEGEPRRQAYYLLDELMFPHLPQGLRTIGYYKNIQQLEREDVLRYYRRRYVPSNAVVCAAGDFEGEEVLSKLEEAFGEWEGPRPRPTTLPEPAPPVSDVLATREMDTELAHVHVGYSSCRLSSPDLYPLDVLAGVLGRGDSSRLAADLKVERNLVYGISAYNYTPTWPGGQFVISFTCEPKNVDRARQAVGEHLARLTREAPSPAEVAKVKRQVVAEMLLGHRTASEQARTLAADQLGLGDPFFTARYVENLQKVRPEDVLAAATKYFPGQHSATAVVRPPSAADESAAEVAPSGKPETTRVELPGSGLTVLIHRTPGQPAVSMLAAMKAGQSVETAETAGITAMTARHLQRGTTTRSEEQINRFFDRRGGRLGADSGWNSLYVQAIVLKRDFEAAFDVFSDVVMNPAFPEDLMPSSRQRQLAALKATRSDPWGACGLYFRQQFFKESPYRFPQTGTEETIAEFSAEDLRAFYERCRVGRNMVLTVAGDVDPSAVRDRVRETFASLEPGRAVEAPAGVEPREVESTEIYVEKVDKPGATVMIGYTGVDLYNLRDRFPMEVFDTVCAGYYMPRGWLHDVLRGQSLVYAVHFTGRAGLLPGYYRSQALCQPEKATRVARLMMDLVASGRDYSYSEGELEKAKTTIIAARKMTRQRPEQVALHMTLDELYGLGYDFEETYLERIRGVAPADVTRVVRKLIDHPVVCITTPKPDAIDMKELQRPYDAEAARKAREEAPAEVTVPRPHTPPR